ncbi:MAG: nucleotidyltransferase domain-containing protein [Taibaiella sp.]|nr:nucleotidyltransferase domain-containing protein [Taibaiella sp.]
MHHEILQQLSEIEAKHNVRILYACESGSRAWGFPSVDSDYDVRFIYAWPEASYLGIEEVREVIELPVNEILDINGWELRKALRLFRGTNSALYEWLQSPVVYKSEGTLLGELLALKDSYFSPRSGMHHYLSMARNAFAELKTPEVRIKKYFYCLRSVLAAMWIATFETLPPMELAPLRALVPDAHLQTIIDELLLLKSASTEKTMVVPIPELHAFVEQCMATCLEKAPGIRRLETATGPLNDLFRNAIK